MIKELKKTKIGLDKNGYTATDREFIKWLVKELGTISASNRLAFRAEVLKILEELRKLQIDPGGKRR